mgnify:CR=1 FL=1
MQNVINGRFRGRSAIWDNGNFGGFDVKKLNNSEFGGKLGLLREYLASVGGKSGQFPKASYFLDFNYVIANPRLRRFFSSEAPKKTSKFFFFFFFFSSF